MRPWRDHIGQCSRRSWGHEVLDPGSIDMIVLVGSVVLKSDTVKHGSESI